MQAINVHYIRKRQSIAFYRDSQERKLSFEKAQLTRNFNLD